MKKILSKFNIKTEEDIFKLSRNDSKLICNHLNLSFKSKDNTKTIQRRIINCAFRNKKSNVSSKKQSNYKFKQVDQNLMFIVDDVTYSKRISNVEQRNTLKQKTLEFIEGKNKISVKKLIEFYTQKNISKKTIHEKENEQNDLDSIINKLTDLFEIQTKAYAESIQKGIKEIKNSLVKKVKKPAYKAKKISSRRGEY